jgi:hypothetical protein
VAGISLCQDYLQHVRDGEIACRPAIEGTRVTLADGRTETVDVIVAATGYAFDVPYLPELAAERYRLSGPGAQPQAAARFAEQLAASPRAPVDPADLAALRAFRPGWDRPAGATAGR